MEKNKTLPSDLDGNGYAGVVPLVRTLPGPKLHVGSLKPSTDMHPCFAQR